MTELIDREQAGKNICKYCASNAYCKEDDCMVYQGLGDTPTIQIEAEPVRHGLLDEDKPLTNGDRIRAMTDEELAKTMRSCKFCAYLDKGRQHNGTCTQGFLEWLKQEVSEDETERTD